MCEAEHLEERSELRHLPVGLRSAHVGESLVARREAMSVSDEGGVSLEEILIRPRHRDHAEQPFDDVLLA